jgi:hypothetical protein
MGTGIGAGLLDPAVGTFYGTFFLGMPPMERMVRNALRTTVGNPIGTSSPRTASVPVRFCLFFWDFGLIKEEIDPLFWLSPR